VPLKNFLRTSQLIDETQTQMLLLPSGAFKRIKKDNRNNSLFYKFFIKKFPKTVILLV